MFKNYVVVTLRNLARQKGFSAINIIGLAIGIACCILILLYVRHELSYDGFHERAERIYRVASPQMAKQPGPLAPLLAAHLPEIETFARIRQPFYPLISCAGKQLYEPVNFADPSVFEFFAFKVIRGDLRQALQAPHTMVITVAMAEKYFGDADPVGQVVSWDNAWDFEIQAVIELPQNTHLDFGFLTSFSTLESSPMFAHYDTENWVEDGWDTHYTYVLLPEDYDAAGFTNKAMDLIEKLEGKQLRDAVERMAGQPVLQPLGDIHLHSHLAGEMKVNSDVSYIYITVSIASFILLLACINFVNLATARSASRAREVGLRKVGGAHKPQLIGQFLGESMIISCIALGLSLVVVEFMLPAFNVFVERELELDPLGQPSILLGIGMITLLVGIGAGLYPAFFLSAFQPARVLKGRPRMGAGGAFLRRGLVIFQFAVSSMLIMGTAIVYSQLEYIQDKKLGLNKDQILVFRIAYPRVRETMPSIREALLTHPGVVAVSSFNALPSSKLSEGWFPTAWAGKTKIELAMPFLSVDPDYLDMLGIELLAGRNFSRQREADRERVLINEAAATALGFDTPQQALGESISLGDNEETIIGVVEDFHFESLHHQIKPMALHQGSLYYYAGVKIRAQSFQETFDFVTETWDQLVPHLPFQPWFLDEDFAQRYRAERRLGAMLRYFAGLSVFVACIGIFALAAFAAEQRTKEIGIRKVLGASVSHIVVLLSRDFFRQIVLANLIAWPATYWGIHLWLENFAYRIDPGVAYFVFGSALTLIVASLTVGYQAVRLALTDPVKALRYE